MWNELSSQQTKHWPPYLCVRFFNRLLLSENFFPICRYNTKFNLPAEGSCQGSEKHKTYPRLKNEWSMTWRQVPTILKHVLHHHSPCHWDTDTAATPAPFLATQELLKQEIIYCEQITVSWDKEFIRLNVLGWKKKCKMMRFLIHRITHCLARHWSSCWSLWWSRRSHDEHPPPCLCNTNSRFLLVAS